MATNAQTTRCLCCDVAYDGKICIPYKLQCSHSVCSGCFFMMTMLVRKTKSQAKCPTCGHLLQQPKRFQSPLPASASHAPKSAQSSIQNANANSSEFTCPTHPQEMVTFFCSTHGTAICRECCISQAHSTCAFKTEKDAWVEDCSLANSMKDSAPRREHSLRTALSLVECELQAVREEGQKAEQTITDQFAELYRALEEQQRSLLKTCRGSTTNKLSSLSEQKAAIEVHLSKFERSFRNLRLHMDKGNMLLALSSASELRDLQAAMPLLGLTAKRGLEYTSNDEARKNLLYWQPRLETSSIQHGPCVIHWDGEALQQESNESRTRLSIPVGVDIKGAVVIRDRHKRSLTYSAGYLDVQLVVLTSPLSPPAKSNRDRHASPAATAPLESSRFIVSVDDQRNGCYTLELSISQPGEYQLRLLLDNAVLSNTIFISAHRLDSAAPAEGVLDRPTRLTIGTDNLLYVADSGSHRVQVFRNDGTLVRTFGSHGSAPGQLASPMGITCAPDGLLYITDQGNHRVQAFKSSGEFVFAWGAQGSAPGQFSYPAGIAASVYGLIYVADQRNDRIQVFTSEGTLVRVWGGPGSSNGFFTLPSQVAVDKHGEVYVLDQGNHRVQVFGQDGVFKRVWGAAGAGPGQFSKPRDLALGDNGDVYVCDTYNNRIQVLSADGLLQRIWGKQGAVCGQFSLPHGVAVDSSGTVFVADTYNHRVQAFQCNGTFIRSISGRAEASAVNRTETYTAAASQLSPTLRPLVGSGTPSSIGSGFRLLQALRGMTPPQRTSPEPALEPPGTVYRVALPRSLSLIATPSSSPGRVNKPRAAPIEPSPSLNSVMRAYSAVPLDAATTYTV